MDDLLKMVLAVFGELNSIPSLRHLYLHIGSQGMFPTGTTSYREWITLPANFRLPFLSQLHTICFKTDGITGIEACLLETLNAIECTDLKQICFHNLMCNFGGKHRNLCTELLQLSPMIKGKFKKIKLAKDRYYFHNEIVETLSAHFSEFTSLTALTIRCTLTVLKTQLSKQFAMLTSLVSLKLEIQEEKVRRVVRDDDDDDNDESDEDDESVGRAEQAKPMSYSPVPSVRLLMINICAPSHQEIVKLQIPEMFPNMQVLRLVYEILKCTACEYDLRHYGAIYERDYELDDCDDMSESDSDESDEDTENKGKTLKRLFGERVRECDKIIYACRRLVREPINESVAKGNSKLRIFKYNTTPFDDQRKMKTIEFAD